MWPFKPKTVSHIDMVAVADDLATVEMPKDYRSSGQMYRDFRAVLINCNANRIQARRVLTQIFQWGSLVSPVHEEGDPYATHVRIGAQQLSQRILMALNTIPKPTEDE